MRRANGTSWGSIAVALLMGCGTGGPTHAMAALVPLEIADWIGPWGRATADEVAYRDGDGPWRRLELADGRGTIEVSDPSRRYGYAVSQTLTMPDQADQRQTSVVYTTVEETPSVRLLDNETAIPARALAPRANVTFDGLEPNESLNVSFGCGSQDSARSQNDGRAVISIPIGQADLLAVRTSTTEGTRVLLRRGQVVPSSGALSIDMSQAVEMVDVPVRVLGAEPGSTLSTWSSVVTSGDGGSFAQTGSWFGAPDDARVQVLPASVSAAGDEHGAFFWAHNPDSNSQGVMVNWPRSARELEARLPAPLAVRVGWDSQSQPWWRWTGVEGTTARLDLDNGMPDDRNTFTVTTSPGWSGELTLGDTRGAAVLDATLAAHTTAASSWRLSLSSSGASALCGSDASLCFVDRKGSFPRR